jgi:hypothetical protein
MLFNVIEPHKLLALCHSMVMVRATASASPKPQSSKPAQVARQNRPPRWTMSFSNA